MGRAIVRQPAAFLMDEPLSNLDAKLRVQMRAEIAKLQRDLGVTTIYVTHDQVEAMTMGDRVAVMRKGELQQVDDPQTLYDRPVNLFVGGFIGSPAMNMLEATIERRNGGSSRRVGTQRIALDDETLASSPALTRYDGQAGDHRHPARAPRGRRARDRTRPPTACLTGRVELREALGSEIMAHFTIDATPAPTRTRLRELAAGRRRDRDAAVGVRERTRRVDRRPLRGSLAGRARAKRSRSRSTRARSISSTRRRDSASTTNPTKGEHT